MASDQQKNNAIPHFPFIARSAGQVIRFSTSGYHVVLKPHISTNNPPPLPGASDDNYHWVGN